MVRWNDLHSFLEEVEVWEHCDHTLRYTEEFCKRNKIDFKHVRSCLAAFDGLCDCIVLQDYDRFKDPKQEITASPDLELGVFWTQLFGFLRNKLKFREVSRRHGGYYMECTGSFMFTEEFCTVYSLDKEKIISILRKANASCDCQVMNNAKRHFEDDALIGTEPTINLYDMKHPIWKTKI